MGIKKIIYVTPGESNHNGLTSVAESQIRKVVSNVLEGEIKDSSKVFITTSELSPSTSETLLSLANKVRKTTEDSGEHLYHNFISNPLDINEVINSTRKGEIAVVGVTQKELKIVLDTLKKEGYDVIDKDKINHRTNIYAVTINPEDKKNSDFFVAPWGG